MNALKTLAVALGILLVAPAAHAEIKTIEADGIYIMGDGTDENPAVSRERARQDAKRAASEKAGVYVESFSEARNGILTEDVIRTVSANVLQIQKSDVKVKVVDNDTFLFTCHVVATVDSTDVEKQLRQDSQDLDEAARLNNELQTKLKNVNAELEDLKNRYAEAQSEHAKTEIRVQVKINEQKFEAGQLVEKGNDFFREKNFQSAVTCYLDAIKIYADDAVAYYRLGNAYRELGDFENAIYNYKKALEINPNYADACNNLGYTFEQTGNFDDAAKNYQRAVNCDSNYANAHYNLGNSYYHSQNYSDAVASYGRAISLNANYILAYNNLGLAYENLGAYDKALESFTRAIDNTTYKSAETSARLYNNRGACYQQMQRFDEALADYDKAVELNPNYSDPLTNREQLRAWLKK